MPSFGVIAEGPTDQTVIENILLGYFDGQDADVDVRYVQPTRPLSNLPAGWGHVFKSLERRDHEGALQYNDYLVIHIDTDVQEEAGFGVPKRAAGRSLTVPERVDRVVARLKQEIDTRFYEANAGRILFAIAVDTIECWLLPLFYNNNKAAKTTGCLESANQALRKANQKALSKPDQKYIEAYEKASGRFRKRITLMELCAKNPSLDLFIQRLKTLQSTAQPKGPVASAGDDQAGAPR